jgi:hypothetical protein
MNWILRPDVFAAGGSVPSWSHRRLARRTGTAREENCMHRTGFLTLGSIIALLGVLFTLQGVGVISGSAMSDTTFWSVAGPVIIVLGAALAAFGLRRRAP